MRFKFLSKHFPPPKFLKPSHIGVSFSDSNIKAVILGGSASKPDLKSVIVPLESGLIVEGKIVNTEEVVKKLLTIKESLNSAFVFFTIPDELTYLFSISIPVAKEGNVAESIAFTIEENVPLSLSDTLFDFVPTNITHSSSEYRAGVIVAACVKKEVESFVGAIQEAGLEVVGCIHESQAIATTLIPKASVGISCVVHARKNRIGIYLIKNDIVYFSTLRSVLEGDYKKQFIDEYEKFLEYFYKYATNEEGRIENIFVCGEFEYAKKVSEAISDSKPSVKNVRLGNVWSNVLQIEKEAPSINYEDSLNLAGPIGAVLSDII